MVGHFGVGVFLLDFVLCSEPLSQSWVASIATDLATAFFFSRLRYVTFISSSTSRSRRYPSRMYLIFSKTSSRDMWHGEAMAGKWVMVTVGNSSTRATGHILSLRRLGRNCVTNFVPRGADRTGSLRDVCSGLQCVSIEIDERFCVVICRSLISPAVIKFDNLDQNNLIANQIPSLSSRDTSS